MGVPYADQLADKADAVARLLPTVPAGAWLAPQESAESGFRNKAKLVVGGRRGRPTLGILDERQRGVDLTGCGLYEPGLTAMLPVLHDLVAGAGIPPYDVAARRGELKNILVTHSPDDRAMVRFVMRSTAELPVVAHNLDRLRERLPGLDVVTVNVLPQHMAVLEGDEEHVLTPSDTLAMPVGDVVLALRPRSFFQTNTAVAGALYRQARAWVDAAAPASVWDLYCGVGGFALHAAAPGRTVVGVETSADAVASATWSARQAGVDAQFVAGDATAYALQRRAPDLVVVNPPRRGIGEPLARWLDTEGPATVVYSSCNASSLARDLAAMPAYAVEQARLFDMFPQTTHHEVMVLLHRR